MKEPMKKFITLALLLSLGFWNANRALHAAAAITLGNDINLTKLTGADADTTVAINPVNTKKIVAFSSHLSGGQAGIQRSYSIDGGVTWSTALIANGADGLYQASFLPDAAFDNFGNLFVTYISSGGAPVVIASTDSGVSFFKVAQLDAKGDEPKIATGPGTAGAASSTWVVFQDQNFNIAASGIPVTGLGAFGAFTPKSIIPNITAQNLDYATVAVGPMGQAVVAFQQSALFGGTAGVIYMSINANGLGGTFAAPVTLEPTNVSGNTGIPAAPFFGIHANAGLAYDLSPGAFHGRLYCVYVDSGNVGSGDTNIFLTYSDNDGTTWAGPRQVNNDTTTYSQFMPRVAVDTVTGAVGLAWFDCRLDTGTVGTVGVASVDHDMRPNTDAIVWGSITTDGGQTFLPQFQISNGSNNANLERQNSTNPTNIDYGNYIGLAYYDNSFVAVWPDNSNSTGDNPDGPQNNWDMYVSVTVVAPGSTTPPPPPPSDLYVVAGSIFLAPPVPKPGEVFTVNATLGNNGPGNAPSFFVSCFDDPANVAFNVGFQTDFSPASGNFLLNATGGIVGCTPAFAAAKKVSTVEVHGGLNAGSTRSVQMQMVYCAPGNYQLAVLANSQRNATEANSFNNQLNFLVTIPSLTTDLTLANFIAVNDPVTPGQNASFTVDIRNLGIKGSGPVMLGFYTNRIAPPTSFDAPDQTFSFPNVAYSPFNTSPPAFTQAIKLPTQNLARAGRAWVFIDYPGAVAETDKTNNIRSAVWGIPNDPPAVLSAISASTQVATVGDNVTFSVGAGDPNGDQLFYMWDFGDGTPVAPAGASVQHAFVAPGVFNVTVAISDGPYNTIQSSIKIQVLDNNIVDLGFVVLKSGAIKLGVPLPPGFTSKDRAKGKIVDGSAGLNVVFKSQRLVGKPGAAGVYIFSIEYLAPKSKKGARVRYKYAILP